MTGTAPPAAPTVPTVVSRRPSTLPPPDRRSPSPPKPPDQDEYEVRVYDARRHRRLVAAVDIVSPANKDRPESRRAFIAKCAELLRQHVCVAIVDLVTTRQFNLYGELLEFLGQPDPALAEEAPPLYAASCCWRRGQTLPTLPLWLAEDLAVPLELEASYEETCRILRIS